MAGGRSNRMGRFPSWGVAVGAMMILLFALLVLLLSISRVDPVRFATVVGSLRGAFGSGDGEAIPLPVREDESPLAGVVAVPEEGVGFEQSVRLVQRKKRVESALSALVGSGDVEIVDAREGFIIRIRGDFLFTAPGTVILRKEVGPTVKLLASLLAEGSSRIDVLAHTDDHPVDLTSPFPTNWSLTAAQAAAVVNALLSQSSVSPLLLRASGMGEYTPLEGNETPAGMARNRRVEFLIFREPTVPEGGGPAGEAKEGGEEAPASASPEAAPSASSRGESYGSSSPAPAATGHSSHEGG
ncbi:MAG: OmpA family protein [Magnetococcales bacterium]|nr:OmpA family protein [Magnetococcales bacterium]MBF0155775.1 OmpA family protein [Magnetococcales bacterium]